jgi:hypothetical protein
MMMCMATTTTGDGMVHVHEFPDGGEAYDASQCEDEIRDGDVLLVTGQGAGVLVQAWPTLVVGEVEAFHTFAEGGGSPYTWDNLDDGKYVESARVAREAWAEAQAEA